MRDVTEREDDESAERALFARRARVAGGALPDFASVLAEVDRRAAEVSVVRAERRGRGVAAASMTIACLAATVAAWIHVGESSHAIVAEPDAGVSAPEAVGVANFSAEEPGSCDLDRSMAVASDDSVACTAPTAPTLIASHGASCSLASAPICSSSSASCEPDVTCSVAGP
jgi:hypothetical protein